MNPYPASNLVRLLFLSSVVLLLSVPISSRANDDFCSVAEEIRMKFESELFTLKPSVQRHFATRMFRLTGEDKYIYSILFDLLITEDQVARDVKNLTNAPYLETRRKQFLENLNPRTRKGKMRRKLFRKNEYRMLQFDLNLLYRCNLLHEFGFHKGAASDDYTEVLNYLKGREIGRFLLDEKVIRVYGAQAANAVYQLLDLGLGDYREEFNAKVQNVFPDNDDASIPDKVFEDKIYTLTHIIIADSRYYQHRVDRKVFQWILDYFENTLDRILSGTKPDVIAEVGISFLLAGYSESGPISRCRGAIVSSIDSEQSMILSTRGSSDLERGEHRNVLAYMLLCWPKSLHDGPEILKTDKYRNLRN